MHQRTGWVTNLGAVNDLSATRKQLQQQRTLLACSQPPLNYEAASRNGSGNDGHAAALFCAENKGDRTKYI
jgi:hypothetical protein